jgi:hypothetical protein
VSRHSAGRAVRCPRWRVRGGGAQDGAAGFAGLAQFEVGEPVQYHVEGDGELLAGQMVAGTVFDPQPECEDL